MIHKTTWKFLNLESTSKTVRIATNKQRRRKADSTKTHFCEAINYRFSVFLTKILAVFKFNQAYFVLHLSCYSKWMHYRTVVQAWQAFLCQLSLSIVLFLRIKVMEKSFWYDLIKPLSISQISTLNPPYSIWQGLSNSFQEFIGFQEFMYNPWELNIMNFKLLPLWNL